MQRPDVEDIVNDYFDMIDLKAKIIDSVYQDPVLRDIAKGQLLCSRFVERNIVYLYLANRSPEESWKNTIKEYDLTGENSVHYNLPAAQQRAVEEFLKVKSFPTYKLIDKHGNIHELEWLHTSNMTLFKETLNRISSMQE